MVPSDLETRRRQPRQVEPLLPFGWSPSAATVARNYAAQCNLGTIRTWSTSVKTSMRRVQRRRRLRLQGQMSYRTGLARQRTTFTARTPARRVRRVVTIRSLSGGVPPLSAAQYSNVRRTRRSAHPFPIGRSQCAISPRLAIQMGCGPTELLWVVIAFGRVSSRRRRV